MFSLLRSKKGATLMEMMVIIPLSLLLVFGLSVALQDLSKNFQIFKSKNETLIVQDLLRDVIRTSALCSSSLRSNTRTFDAVAATAGTMNLSFSVDGGTVIETGASLVSQNLRINSLTYKVLPDGINFMDDLSEAGNRLQYGFLMAEIAKISQGQQARSQQQTLTGLVLSVNAANQITRCFLVDDSVDACGLIGGHPYNDGTHNYCYSAVYCPPPKLLKGADASGAPICVDLGSFVGTQCPSGQFLATNSAGVAVCTPPGSTVAGGVPPVPSGGSGGPVTCDQMAINPDTTAGAAMSVLGTISTGTGCFYNEKGVIAFVYFDPTTKNFSIGAGPASGPDYPLSSFTVTNVLGGGSVSHPSGASISYP